MVFSKGFGGSLAASLGLAMLIALPATANEPDAGATYSLRVPVVDATPIVTRRVESYPERHCQPVRSSREYATPSYTYDSRYDSRYDSYRGEDYRRGDHRREAYRQRNNVGARILGGIIGGAIGNQFGKGNGRKALTVAGALVGSSIASNNSSYRNGSYRNDRGRRHRDYEPEYVCETSTRERVVETVTGFDVTYRYNGALHVKRMDYDPGDSIELRITAAPHSSAGSSASSSASRSTSHLLQVSPRAQAPRSPRRIL